MSERELLADALRKLREPAGRGGIRLSGREAEVLLRTLTAGLAARRQLDKLERERGLKYVWELPEKATTERVS